MRDPEPSASSGGTTTENRRVTVEIVFETHSISTDNEDGIATGWLDGRLSERGREKARELGRRRCEAGVAAVFTSDLGRAVETAEIAFGDSGIPIRRDARLRECDYGELNGAPAARVTQVRSLHVDDAFPGGQSYRDVVEQVRSFLDDLAAEYEGKRVLVIGHSATRWALGHLLTGTPLEELVEAPFEWQEGWEYQLR
jgi:broad specificity phosphatase PhoE